MYRGLTDYVHVPERYVLSIRSPSVEAAQGKGAESLRQLEHHRNYANYALRSARASGR